MQCIDLSGVIKDGIWTYGEMYPNFHQRSIKAEENRFFCEVFEGFTSQTGTYLETTAHINGYAKNVLVEDIPIEKLVNIPCCVIKLDCETIKKNGNKIIAQDFIRATIDVEIEQQAAILFSSGWSNWYDDNFLTDAPYLSTDAMEWLLSKNPFLIGSDTPAWEKDEPIFEIFAKTNTLLLAPLVNLDAVQEFNTRLTVLPLNIPNTCCVPARAILY